MTESKIILFACCSLALFNTIGALSVIGDPVLVGLFCVLVLAWIGFGLKTARGKDD